MEASINNNIQAELSAAEQRASAAPEGYFFVQNVPFSTDEDYSHGVHVAQNLDTDHMLLVSAFEEDGQPLPLGLTLALYKKTPEKRGVMGIIKNRLAAVALRAQG